MRLNPTLCLSDILEAIELIEEFVPSSTTTFQLESDKKTLSALKHQFAVIGEAVYTLRTKHKLDMEFMTNYKKVEGLRHLIVHDYYRVEANILLVIMKKNLPVLKTEVQQKMNAWKQENPSEADDLF